jgi:hypothetical protein
MSTVFIIASTKVYAQNEINTLKKMIPPLPEGTLVVPVLSDADLRGRVVKEGDAVIIAYGGWAGVMDERVTRIVVQFNTIAEPGAPLLDYQRGQPPTVKSRLPVGTGLPGHPAIAENFPASNLKNVVLTLDGELIELREANINVHGTYGQRTSIVATSATGDGVWLPNRDVLTDLRDHRETDLKLIKEISARVNELVEWLSGVQPIEDEDIPGLYRCGVCHRRAPHHTDGCPADAEPDY